VDPVRGGGLVVAGAVVERVRFVAHHVDPEQAVALHVLAQRLKGVVPPPDLDGLVADCSDLLQPPIQIKRIKRQNRQANRLFNRHE
jgi:hypothetical protein